MCIQSHYSNCGFRSSDGEFERRELEISIKILENDVLSPDGHISWSTLKRTFNDLNIVLNSRKAEPEPANFSEGNNFPIRSFYWNLEYYLQNQPEQMSEIFEN